MDQTIDQQEDEHLQLCYLTDSKATLSDHDSLYFFLLHNLQ